MFFSGIVLTKIWVGGAFGPALKARYEPGFSPEAQNRAFAANCLEIKRK
jgi:hypothetical protein